LCPVEFTIFLWFIPGWAWGSPLVYFFGWVRLGEGVSGEREGD